MSSHSEHSAATGAPDATEKSAADGALHPGIRASRFTLFGVLINVALAAVKGIAGVVGNSYALIADAMESTLDVFSSLVVWGGLRIASAPPDSEHPYGHGKAEALAAIVVAMLLIVAAGGLAIKSVHEILVPHHAPAPFTLAVLVGVIVVKEVLFRTVMKGSMKFQSTALATDAWHHRSDALTSAAAFIGILIALIGGEGYESADDYAALFACAIIAYNGYRLLRPALNEAMDAAPDPAIEGNVRAVAGAVDRVVGLDQCIVRKHGFDYYVDLHVLVDGDLSVRDGHDIAHVVKEALKASNERIADVLIHIEPEDAHIRPDP